MSSNVSPGAATDIREVIISGIESQNKFAVLLEDNNNLKAECAPNSSELSNQGKPQTHANDTNATPPSVVDVVGQKPATISQGGEAVVTTQAIASDPVSISNFSGEAEESDPGHSNYNSGEGTIPISEPASDSTYLNPSSGNQQQSKNPSPGSSGKNNHSLQRF